MNRTIGRIIIYILAAFLVTGFALAAVMLPEKLLRAEAARDYDVVRSVPTEYYSGPSEAVVKNSSRQLSELERVRLITGVWESTTDAVDEGMSSLTSYEAHTLAIDGIRELCQTGLYPIDITSDYKDWYSWTGRCYRAIDTTFETYAAVYWDMTFVKYDNSELHRVILTETGTVLYASVQYLNKGQENNEENAAHIQTLSELTQSLQSEESAEVSQNAIALNDYYRYTESGYEVVMTLP